MQKAIGIICLVAGVLFLMRGYQIAESFGGQVHRIFTNSTNNKTTWMYVGGAVLCTTGVFLIYRGKK